MGICTKRKLLVLAVTLLTAASSLASVTDNTRLRIHGDLTTGLKPELKLTLNASNPLCWGKTKIVEAHSEIENGKYEITASWDPGLCGYERGLASFIVNGY